MKRMIIASKAEDSHERKRYMKRYIRSATFQPQRFKEYYINELIDDGVITEDEVDDVLRINYTYLTEEDADLFLRGITNQGFRPGEIVKVDYSMDDDRIDNAGMDGAYSVTFDDGNIYQYGWRFGRPQLSII